jgi:hypothetical protein
MYTVLHVCCIINGGQYLKLDYNVHVHACICMQVPILPIRKGMRSDMLSAIYYSSRNRNVRISVPCAHVMIVKTNLGER